MPFPCSLRRLVWSAARAGAQGPCALVQTKALELNTNRGWCDKWGMRVSQGFAMGGIGPVGVIMKPADHRSTGMRHSPRILPLGHRGTLAHVSPLEKLRTRRAAPRPGSALAARRQARPRRRRLRDGHPRQQPQRGRHGRRRCRRCYCRRICSGAGPAEPCFRRECVSSLLCRGM